MRKRILSLFLALALLCGLLPQLGLTAHAATHSGTCGAEGDGSNLKWSFDDDTGVLTITGSGAMKNYDDENGPWADYSETITAISLPDGLTRIGNYAFYDCEALASVTIPDGVTRIGSDAFCCCFMLSSVTIPDSVTSIGRGAFVMTAYYDDSANWENGLLYIGKCLINANESITTAQIRPGTSCIADGVFYICENSLQSVTIPGSVKSIDREMFCRFIALTSVTIEDGVEKIGECAFLDCRALKSVTIPASVTDIGPYAFGFQEIHQRYERIDGFTIYGDYGTEAQRYANNKGFIFLPLQVNPFVDVKESDFYFNPVQWAVANDVTSGTDPTHFSLAATVKRSEAMLFFYAAKGRPAFKTTTSPFKDVKKKHWFYDAVLWAVENKITSGTDATHFSPNKTCVRSEILQFLYAAMGKPGYTIANPYSDVKDKHWYKDGAIWAYENGLEKGENGKFKAKTPCTRAYVVTYLYRFITGNELAQ